MGDHDLSQIDIALLNLVCASGLPGAGPLRIDHYLEWLDDAAAKVKLATDRNYHKFLESPEAFEFSQARFCMVCLVTVLQRDLGAAYNPKWKCFSPDDTIPPAFGVDASDLFIYAIVDGIGGTCGSLPVLYVAVARRLGYPVRLVKAARHLFVRWDDREGRHWFHGDCFNVEATGPGVHFLPDEHYRRWPRPIPDQDIESRVFLSSLSPREEFAEFLATRGYCLHLNGRLREASDAFANASRLAPNNRYFAHALQAIKTQIIMRQRGYAFLNVSPTFDQDPVGPFWMQGPNNEKLLVQVVSPVTQPYSLPPKLGLSLERQRLQTPSGLFVDAWIPHQSAASPMTARWVCLQHGRYALVHQADSASLFPSARAAAMGRPVPVSPYVVPQSYANGNLLPHFVPDHSDTWQIEGTGYLASHIEITVQQLQHASDAGAPEPLRGLAAPAGPHTPYLSPRPVGFSITT